MLRQHQCYNSVLTKPGWVSSAWALSHGGNYTVCEVPNPCLKHLGQPQLQDMSEKKKKIKHGPFLTVQWKNLDFAFEGHQERKMKAQTEQFHICVSVCPTQQLIHPNQNFRCAPHFRICPLHKGCCRCEFIMRILCTALIQPICQSRWARRGHCLRTGGICQHPPHKELTRPNRQVGKARLTFRADVTSGNPSADVVKRSKP